MIEHYVDGRRVYTVGEAAELLGAKPETIRQRLHRANIEPVGHINPREPVYRPGDLGLFFEFFEAEEEEPRMRYTTAEDAIDQEILPVLDGESEYDVRGIFHEAFDWKIEINERGQELLDSGGFEQVVSNEEFAEIVEKYREK